VTDKTPSLAGFEFLPFLEISPDTIEPIDNTIAVREFSATVRQINFNRVEFATKKKTRAYRPDTSTSAYVDYSVAGAQNDDPLRRDQRVIRRPLRYIRFSVLPLNVTKAVTRSAERRIRAAILSQRCDRFRYASRLRVRDDIYRLTLRLNVDQPISETNTAFHCVRRFRLSRFIIRFPVVDPIPICSSRRNGRNFVSEIRRVIIQITYFVSAECRLANPIVN